MNKYDFIREKIEEVFERDKWLVVEDSLRRQCMFVFLIWLELVKKRTIERVGEKGIKILMDEWVSAQKMESEYDKKYKEDKTYTVLCKQCVFKLGDEEKSFCIRYAKEVDENNDCKNEVGFEGSEYYGELLDYLNMLGVYGG